MNLKLRVFKTTGSKAALRSPPHITLHMPFKWPVKKEALLKNSLATLCKKMQPFNICLQGFGCFEPRVVYVNVPLTPGLKQLKQNITRLAKATWKLDSPKDMRGFTPHITIGFRDLKKTDFYALWEQLKDEKYHANMRVNALALLKHDGHRWRVESSFSFGPENTGNPVGL